MNYDFFFYWSVITVHLNFALMPQTQSQRLWSHPDYVSQTSTIAE